MANHIDSSKPLTPKRWKSRTENRVKDEFIRSIKATTNSQIGIKKKDLKDYHKTEVEQLVKNRRELEEKVRMVISYIFYHPLDRGFQSI